MSQAGGDAAAQSKKCDPTLNKPPHSAIPNDGRLDPASIDVAARKPRKRKARNRPAPSPELVVWAERAEKRLLARPYPPGIMLEPAGFNKEHWTSPHADVGLWQDQLGEAFGTRSKAVITLFLRQLEALCSEDQWDEEAKQWRLDENEFSAALAMVSAIKPRNEMEAALAAQMVSIHLMQMKCAARAIRFEHDTQTASVAAKLARTFVMQTQALQALRGRPKTARQSIKVMKELHQHVHYHRGAGESDGQPQATPAGQPEELRALPSPDETGNTVPHASRKREANVPDARGSTGDRRA